jgi:LysR family transcriptional regulator, regulator for genes of the gallate degradation pathway
MPSPYDLNLRHLRALSEIVARGSMSAAAEAVSLSQPALTQGLRKLEQQLGVALFERHSNGLLPTGEGLIMATRADAAFAALGAATRGAARSGGRGFARPERLMTATQLNATLALADAGSFVAAATATGLSQPALHRAVRDLEQVCGVPIANRQGRGIALTPLGRQIVRGIRLAAAEIAAGIADLSADSNVAGRIVLGALPLCRALVLPHAIATFLGGTPRAAIDVVEGSWRELVDPLREGRIDLMIGALRPEPLRGLEQRALFEDRLAIVGRADHPLTAIAQPSPGDLRRFGWVVGQTRTPLRAHWDALFADGAPPPTPVECGSVMVIRGILAASDLLTLLSPDQVALEVESGVLAMIAHAGAPAIRTIGITTRTGWRPTTAQRRFVTLIEEAARATRLSKIL